MASLIVAILVLCCYTLGGATNSLDDSKHETYIVYVHHPDNVNFQLPEERNKFYESFLPTSDMRSSRMVYYYGEAIKGFAARLTPEEVEFMKKKQGFAAAFSNRLVPLHTTHTPDFLGLTKPNGLWSNNSYGQGVIIGLLDTGITPDHPSFRGDNMPSPPKKWKGRCDLPTGLCNNKLIGFRSLLKSKFLESNRNNEPKIFDTLGHGTHTAAIAAGAPVDNANVLGNANGTAVGMAPSAHLAMYKVCQGGSCWSADVVAGLDAAVEDGVDILSMSLGHRSRSFSSDPLVVATFRATQKGVFVSCAAGNNGPDAASLSNDEPWVLTVAASTTDRSIRSTVKLGNGIELNGESLYQPNNFSSLILPLVEDKSYCDNFVTHVEGKIVVCWDDMPTDIIEKVDDVVNNPDRFGMVKINSKFKGYTILTRNYTIPVSRHNHADGAKIKSYLSFTNSTPTARIIFKGTLMGTNPSPTIAYFSSRGPSVIVPSILKPDITGPGVNIIAAWRYINDQDAKARPSKYSFNVISGTSMSTPHLSGIAALLKSLHPNWSPAAIKSAMMTTSYIVDSNGDPIKDEQHKKASMLSMGAGHVDPTKAEDPGLVYDAAPKDYISLLCELYNDAQVGIMVGRKVRCNETNILGDKDFNYPSMIVPFNGQSSTANMTRIVTNVGPAKSTYIVKVDVPEGVVVTVKPEKLEFSNVNERKSYTVKFVNKSGGSVPYSEGHLSWVSDKHVVRIPILVTYT